MSVGGKFVSLWVFEVDNNVEGPSSLGILFLIKNLSILVHSTHTQNFTLGVCFLALLDTY
jgi:hypothetical protein